MKKVITHTPFMDVFMGIGADRCGIDSHQFLLSVQHNLNSILNSRNRIFEISNTYPLLRDSILDYGIMDFSSINIASEAGQEQLALAIQHAIQRFEPRIIEIHVIVLPSQNNDELSIRFRIEATVNIKPNNERILWDSLIEPVSRHITLSEALHA